jgi:basic amino acid/polyamine antiporter, APA family
VLAIAQVGSLFSADAWNNVTFTAGEVKNPSRNLPLSLALGTGVVIALYIACNFIYLGALPLVGSPAERRCSSAAFSTPPKTASPPRS